VTGVAPFRFACALATLFTLHVWCGSIVRAQAWVPDRGDGSVSFTYQNYDVAGHFDVMGRENTNGGTRSHVLATEVDYGVTDNFGLTVTLPFIASKYTGPPSYFVGTHETHPGPLDDGRYHGAFQDVRVEVRRLFWAGPVPIAPFVGASFPTHKYETVGEAVPGRRRRDFQFGANAGFNLDRVLRGSYVQARYAFATAERVNTFPFTRSNIDVEGGYSVMSRVLVRGLMNRQVRHQGPSLDQLSADWEHHDRFIAPSYLNLGGGVSLSLTGSADVYALWVATVSGNNGAHRARTLAIGVTLGLGSGLQGLGGAGTALPSLGTSRHFKSPFR
jgi:hypothetical protein